jgi:hypothetical protein
MPDDIESALQQATKGLQYMSETDAPFEVVHWTDTSPTLDARKVLELSGHKAKDPVQIMSVEDFFKPLVDPKSWHGTAEKAHVRRYQELLGVIKTKLSDPQVFRAGQIQIDIFVVGKTPQGDWMGVKTRAVET